MPKTKKTKRKERKRRKRKRKRKKNDKERTQLGVITLVSELSCVVDHGTLLIWSL